MSKQVFKNLNNSSHLHESLIFQAENVSVNYGKIKALNNVTFSIKRGEVIFVTGKSAAGKSTLLNVLAGDVTPKSGRLINAVNDRFIAQVFQDVKLLHDLTLEENLLMSFDSALYKSKKEFKSDLNELIQFMGLGDRIKIKAINANGGLKQKVALIRALMTKPEIILCDEPTSSCDKESSIKFFELLNYYNVKKGLTIIWASHNKELVKQFPGTMLHLDSGKLVYSGHACFI